MCRSTLRSILPLALLLIFATGLRAQFDPPDRLFRLKQPEAIVIQPQQGDPFSVPATIRPADTPHVPIMPPPPPLPTREPIPPYRLRTLVDDLQSGDYQKRLRATRELKAGGAETVAVLRKVAQTGSPEVYRRAVTVLESIFLCDDGDANRAAEDALESLRTTGAVSLALHIDDVFESNQTVRSQRALADIQALGGQVEFVKDIHPVDPKTGELLLSVSHIRIPLSWTGGDDGLKHVARLDRVGQLYVIKTSDDKSAVSPSGVQKLLTKMPHLRVEHRGSAQIGLRFSAFQTIKGGLQLEDVPAQFAAGRAGLKSGDILTALDGRKIETFDDLTTALQHYSPQDKVAAEVLRPAGFEQYEPAKLEVTLDGWDE